MRKWKPKYGERYYYISHCGSINSTRAGYSKDTIFRIATGNYFKSFAKCQNVLKKLLEKLNLPSEHQHGLGKVKFTVRIPHSKIPEEYLPISNKDIV